MHNLFSRALALWLPLACAICGLFVFSYWAVQQNYRWNLNDPQIQMAEDGAAMLSAGAPPASLTRDKPSVDIRTSLAPWIVVYDSSGTPLESTAVLDGAPPHLPPGVFDTSTWRALIIGHHVNQAGPNENIFSWQPRSDVRQAVALVAVGNGQFVAAGRNMREAEGHVAVLTSGAAAAWGATELGTLVVIVILLALGWL